MLEFAEEFVRLRCSDDPSEYFRAAHEPASIEVWLDVIHRYPDMRFWVAHNKTVPIEILEVLAHDPDSRVRSMVADKRKLPERLQLLLANDPDAGVRLRVACNSKATRSVLELLTQDPWDRVRERAHDRLADGKYVT